MSDISEIKKVEVPKEANVSVDTSKEVKNEVVSTSSSNPKVTKKFFKSFVDVKKWSSYDEVSSNAKTTLNLFRRLFGSLKLKVGEVRQESYEEAIARLNLSEEQIITRKNNLLYSSMVYAAFAVGFFIYLIFLLFELKLLAVGLMLILVVLMSLVAYREHFWYMQMEKKKLGCNFQDWLAFVLKR